MIVAATAEVNDCLLVTDCDKHFPGIPVLNPMVDTLSAERAKIISALDLLVTGF